MNKIELLSPAGSMKALIAAVQAGCNAVYLAGKTFGARSYADNFDNDALTEAVIYAHLHNVKVYVTVNTIVLEEEFGLLDEYLKFLTHIHVDAIIVQDLGVIRYSKLHYPTLEVHASTQLNVFDKKASDYLQKMGVSRVVLARETPLLTAKEIAESGIEVEIFIHGALCFSSSGNCLMSSVIGKRSGNRGKCAQPCRKNYTLLEDDKIITTDKALISMKDLMTLEHIPEIIESKVCSLKIEGRMKSPEYVYTVTKAYKDAIDAYYNKKSYQLKNDTLNNLLVTFNRKFTKGYLLNESNSLVTNTEFVNHRGIKVGKIVDATPQYIKVLLTSDIKNHDGLRILSKEEYGLYLTTIYVNNNIVKVAKKGDIVKLYIKNRSKKGDIVVKTSDSNLSSEIEETLKCENAKTFINLNLTMFAGEKIVLTAKDEFNNQVIVTGDVLDYSDQILDEIRIKEQLSKLSKTPYQVKKIFIKTDNACFVKISMLNDLRRQMVKLLDEKRLKNITLSNYKYSLNYKVNPTKTSDLFEVVTTTDKQTEVCQSFNISHIYALNKTYSGRIIDDNKEMAHNLSQIRKGSVLSPYFNIINQEALKVAIDLGASKCYLSPEINLDSIKDLNLSSINLEVGQVVYGRIDLMVSKHCLVGKEKGAISKNCGNCMLHKYAIVDEFGNKFPLIMEKDNGCTMRIVDYHKLNLYNYLDKLKDLGIKKFLLIFTDEKEDEVRSVLDYFINNKKTNLKPYTGFMNEKIL